MFLHACLQKPLREKKIFKDNMISMCIINSQTICDVIPRSSFAQLIDKQEQESLSLPAWLALNVILSPHANQIQLRGHGRGRPDAQLITSMEKKKYDADFTFFLILIHLLLPVLGLIHLVSSSWAYSLSFIPL